MTREIATAMRRPIPTAIGGSGAGTAAVPAAVGGGVPPPRRAGGTPAPTAGGDAGAPENGPILVITDGACDVLRVRREHAFLLPEGSSLPFAPRGKVFAVR